MVTTITLRWNRRMNRYFTPHVQIRDHIDPSIQSKLSRWGTLCELSSSVNRSTQQGVWRYLEGRALTLLRCRFGLTITRVMQCDRRWYVGIKALMIFAILFYCFSLKLSLFLGPSFISISCFLYRSPCKDMGRFSPGSFIFQLFM